MDKDTERLVLDLLAQHNILTLATVREDGYPQATTVGYVNDGLTLYVGASPRSQKVRNIQRNPRVSLTVDHDYEDWNQIRGLSMGGIAGFVTDPQELRHVLGLMRRKFPQLETMPVPVASEAITLLKITPEVISVLDYRKGFGHTELVAPGRPAV